MTETTQQQFTCSPEERTVLDMIKYWPGTPAQVTWSEKQGWIVGTLPEHLPVQQSS